MNAWDVVVHASVRPEPFGRVILEGMLLGKPVIATAAGGVPELIDDGRTGFLVPPGDATALADCLRRVLADARRGAGDRGARPGMGAAAFLARPPGGGDERNLRRCSEEPVSMNISRYLVLLPRRRGGPAGRRPAGRRGRGRALLAQEARRRLPQAGDPVLPRAGRADDARTSTTSSSTRSRSSSSSAS